jgi:mitogen-activated protein kinase kinase
MGPRLPAPRPGGPRGPPLSLSTHNAPLPSPTPTPPPQSTGKRPKLGLAIAKDEKFDVYAGGPNEGASTYLSPGSGDDGKTIVPPGTTHSNGGATIVARDATHQQPIDQLTHRIKTISTGKSMADSDAQIPTIASDWSDADFEELASLGEGAGGAVHKVKHKPTGRVLARKTITTREAPMKQLLRELNIMSSTTHPNIVTFYGVYMSPSSSEVKILMELCEGGSLESVAKKIRERGAIVGEKIAGRIAEGVSLDVGSV